MLLPDNIHPESTLLYNGALILKALRRNGKTPVLELYLETKQGNNMSMPLFVLSLDWLFLADHVVIDKEGRVTVCS